MEEEEEEEEPVFSRPMANRREERREEEEAEEAVGAVGAGVFAPEAENKADDQEDAKAPLPPRLLKAQLSGATPDPDTNVARSRNEPRKLP